MNADGVYQLGLVCGRCAAASRVAELRDAWKPYRRATTAEIVARRVTELESHAREFAQRLGRPYADWPGGTAAEAVAWCRLRDASAYDQPHA